VGDRVRVTYGPAGGPFFGQVGVIKAINSKGTASIALAGWASEYTFDEGEFERVEGGAA
jgi:hypothetical protein